MSISALTFCIRSLAALLWRFFSGIYLLLRGEVSGNDAVEGLLGFVAGGELLGQGVGQHADRFLIEERLVTVEVKELQFVVNG